MGMDWRIGRAWTEFKRSLMLLWTSAVLVVLSSSSSCLTQVSEQHRVQRKLICILLAC
jgi:hypothetical protein